MVISVDESLMVVGIARVKPSAMGEEPVAGDPGIVRRMIFRKLKI